MNKLQEFTPVFTEELPYKKDMEFGKIYISREHEVACFLCPCGCGEVHHISFMKGLRNQWVFTEDNGRVTNPDVVADFRHIPFPDNHFHLVLFDPPHFRWAGDNSNLAKNYGRLPADWGGEYIGDGFCECMRVLKPNGILIFKWNEQQIKLKTIMKHIPYEPLFGHLTGRSGHTYWMCFMKIKNNAYDKK